ncbi:hypothetical protein RRG08_024923 [Elysia crispata]|uniref:Nuclear pore complex protein n=1 Tax=Elysia crispata TaxID=231223 RepID=A0AAE1DQH2_9GAST|nr:hypothetical protein RRG08_024923 [Elysia crispata]
MFREVTVPVSNSTRWKSITICTGASASTLQDIKVPESCGGYTYLDSGVAASGARNRFIYWRTYQDVLELVEESMDTTLSGNMVRYRFQDSPILPNVSIHEGRGSVIVLVPTVASIHRLVFPHPSRMARQQTFVLTEQVTSSIFYDASLPDDQKNQFLLAPGGSLNAQLVRAASFVTEDGHALFAMATTTGTILLITMPPLGVNGTILQQELSCSSVMKKLWNGLIPGTMRGNQPAGESALSLELMLLGSDIYIFTACRDFRMRVWSTKTKECVLVENLLDFTSEEAEDSANPVSYRGSGHVLKTVLGGNSNGICIFLSLQNKTKFVFLTPVMKNGRLKMEHLTTLDKSPLEDLLDFVVTETFLLSLWTTQAGDTQVLAIPLSQQEENQVSEWESIYLSQALDQVVVPQNRDPREFFLAKIFSPGLFSAQDIVRALSVYRRCAAPAVESEAFFNMAALREEVTNAVDTEIRNSVSDYEIQEEAYMDIQQEQWEKFYSCCYQYNQVGGKAKGLFADPITGLFGIIKKSTFSVLRPCDRTEMLYLSPTCRLSETVIENEGLAGDDFSAAQFANDMRLVCDAVQLISSQIPPDVSVVFYSNFQSVQEPDDLITNMCRQLSCDAEVTDGLVRLVCEMSSPVSALEAIFNMLQVVDDLGSDLMDTAEAVGHAHYSHLFSGSLGVSIMTQSFHQLASLRFCLIRDLTLFISMVTNLRERVGLDHTVLDTFVNELLPSGVHLLRCYKLLVWGSEALSTVSSNNTQDINLRQLESLNITEKTPTVPTNVHGSQPTHLMKLFLEQVGGEQVRRRLAAVGEGSQAVWAEDLQQFLLTLSVLIWPASEDTILPEFLVRSCQYLRLEEYVHLLTPWCTWNEGSRAFFLGLAYLHFDEPVKAVKLFVDASDGVATESFLLDKLLQTEETDYTCLQILYYLKVIKQLEEHGLPDLVITMATQAINKAKPDDPNLPTLQSKIFMQHLELGHNQEAFIAMMNNPDTDRRKDCLRQFLIIMCDRGHLSDLVSFDYGDLEEEVVYILENRARSVDLSTHDYYSLLYSFFTYRENHRKAGRVMYERGLRLSQEVPGLRSLQQQAQSHLAALNSLYLVQPEYAWIVKPVLRQQAQRLGQRAEDDGMESRKSVKHDADGNQKERHLGPKKLEILELSDLQKDYLLLDARLRLIRNQPDSALVSGPMPSPEEILSQLCVTGLYDMAVSVTLTFSLSRETVLASIALRCVSLTTISGSSSSMSAFKTSGPDPSSAAWEWLRENNIPPCGARESSAADKAWSLLQSYLSKLEDGSGRCHKCVAHTLLSQRCHLPTWLVNSFKRLDVSSLLRVYLTFDLLSEAASLTCDYLEGVTDSLTGADEPAFGLKGQDVPRSLSVWVPYSSVDQLLAVLSEADTPTHSAMYQKVKEKLDKYQTKSSEISREISAY